MNVLPIKKIEDLPENCRLCKAPLKGPDIVGNFVYGGTSRQKFYRCPRCDAAFLYPPMKKEEESRFYSNEFEKFMEKRSGKDFDWSGPEAHIKSNEKQFKRRLPFFEEFIRPGRRVLEIGCSSGFMLLPLKEMGLDVIGVEPSGNFAGFLKKQGIPVYDSTKKLHKIEGRSQAFDLVMHFFVLEHIGEPIAFLKDALKLVKPGGKMVFEIPSRDDPLLSIYNIPAFHKFYWSVAHNYYFNRVSLEFIMSRLGEKFEILAEQRYDLSNHVTWALEGKPGGQGRFSGFFTPELERAYSDSMKSTGHCDTLVVRVHKKEGKA